MSVATLSMSMEQRRELSRLNRPRASRCLYGSPDPAELNRKYKEVSLERMQRFRDRWGYDPERDCPVTDHERYQWERVGAAEDAPKPPASPPTAEREHRDSSPDEPSVAVSTKSPKQKQQTTMEDYFPERKRSSGSASGSLIKKKQRLSSDESSSSPATPPLEDEECASSSSQQVN